MMTWDYATGQEYVRIEEVEGDEVGELIVEIPLSLQNAERIAETICNAHNSDPAVQREEM